MNTTAGVLADIISQMLNSKEDKRQWVDIVAEVLNIFEGDVRAQAVSRLRFLYFNTKSKIEALPHPEHDKQVARQHLARFGGFENFSAFPQTLEAAKRQFITIEAMSDLRSLNMIISQVAPIPNVKVEIEQPIEALKKAVDEIRQTDLPDDILAYAVQRLNQVLEVAENFELYSPEELAKCVDALIGQISVSKESYPKNVKVILKSAATAAATIVATVVGVDHLVQSYLSLEENLPKLIEDQTPKQIEDKSMISVIEGD